MNFSEFFPEVERYWATEMTPARLAMGAGTTLVVCLCLLFAGQAAGDAGGFLFFATIIAQAIILLGYGTARTAGSIIGERAERTWDLQRLTPLSSMELAGGKLFGAPIFAYFLAANFAPWTIVGRAMMHKAPPIGLLWCFALLASGTFLFLSAGLLVSAYSDRLLAGSSPTTAVALMAFFSLQAGIVLFNYTTDRTTLTYYGLEWNSRAFICLSALAFGGWALAAARWRIGKELLEGRRFWRLPVFLAFITLYQRGFSQESAPPSIIVPVFICYFASVLNPETLDHWKKWANARGDEWWDLVPTWLAGALTCAVMGGVLSAFGPKPSGPYLSAAAGRFPPLAVAFLIRDLCFLQWCRFTHSRRPEVMAAIFVALAYFLPGIVVASFRAPHLAYLFYPIPDDTINPALNLLPGLLQAAAGCGILYARFDALTSAAATQ